LFQLTREIVDSSNPAIDAIAMQAMGEAYSQQTEGVVYTKLNGANGVGRHHHDRVRPVRCSGVDHHPVAGDELIAGIRAMEALYPFRRFAAPDRGYLSQEATSALATAVDTTGRPLLPSVGGQNAYGSGNTLGRGWDIDGLIFEPCWSMTGNAAGDATCSR
jgi:hypothetical protein